VNGQNGLEGLRVGFVLFVALIILTAGLYVVAFKPSVVGDVVYFKTYLNETGGLRPGAPVWLGGVEIGTVSDIAFTEESLVEQGKKSIEVILAVERRFAKRIKEDSVCRVQSRGLLGEKIVTIKGGSPDKPAVAPLGSVPSEEGGDVEEVIARAGSGVDRTAEAAIRALEEVRRLLVDIRNQRGLLGKLIYSDDFYNDTVGRIEEIVSDLRKELAGITNTLKEEIGRFRQDASKTLGTADEEIRATGKDLRAAAKELKKDLEEVGGLLSDLKAGKGTGGLLLRDEEFADRLRLIVEKLSRASERFASVAEKVDEGKGTVGLLVNDPTAYTSLRDLFEGVQESWLLRGAVRSAEATGRRLRIERQKEKSAEKEESENVGAGE